VSSSQSSSGGIGFMGLLALLFVGLKLTGYIAWSWWWVLAPMWAPTVVAIIVLAVVFAIEGFTESRRRKQARLWEYKR
jgi:hypothetical protein